MEDPIVSHLLSFRLTQGKLLRLFVLMEIILGIGVLFTLSTGSIAWMTNLLIGTVAFFNALSMCSLYFAVQQIPKQGSLAQLSGLHQWITLILIAFFFLVNLLLLAWMALLLMDHHLVA